MKDLSNFTFYNFLDLIDPGDIPTSDITISGKLMKVPKYPNSRLATLMVVLYNHPEPLKTMELLFAIVERLYGSDVVEHVKTSPDPFTWFIKLNNAMDEVNKFWSSHDNPYNAEPKTQDFSSIMSGITTDIN